MHVNRVNQRHDLTSKGFLRRHALRAAAAAVPLLAAGAGTALGVPNKFNIYTGNGTQSWSDPTGWSDGAPTAEDQVRVAGSGTFNLAAAATVNSLAFGYGDNLTPTLNVQTGAALVSANDIVFGGTGAVAGSNNVLATLNQTGGSIHIPANRIMWMGLGGSAVWNMSGGTTTVGYPGFSSLSNLGVSIGTGVGTLPSTSTLNMSGGVINSDAVFEVARNNATGIVNMTGGTINVGTEVWIGQPGSTGGQATITQSAGTLNVGMQYGAQGYGNVLMGVGNAGKAASYTLSGTGAINVYRHMFIGGATSGLGLVSGGEGDFVMNGGTLSIGDPRQVSGAALFVGWARNADAAKGTFTLNSGTVTTNLPGGDIVAGSFANNADPLPAGQSATITINGGQMLAPRGQLEIGRSGANGTVNLAGGQLAVNVLRWKNPVGNTFTRTFNFTGGILDANTANIDYVLTNAGGTFRPGGSSVLRTFSTSGTDGSYAQTAGTLALDVASAADFDALNLSGGTVGAANLSSGTVNVSALAGYVPAFGVSIPAIRAKTISDTATWNLPALAAGNAWDRRISNDGTTQVESLVVVRSAASAHSAGADWTTATWGSGTPNATDASAKLGAAGGSINLDAPVTVGYLQLDGGSWTVSGANALTVATSGGATGGIAAFGGAHTISAPVVFNADASIGTQLSSTSVTLAGDVSGASTVTKTGPGSLTLTSTTSSFTGTWGVSRGSLNIASDANLGAPAAGLALGNAAVNVTGGGWVSGRNIALNAGVVTLDLAGDSTLSGVISGTGGLTKMDANLLVLGSANTYAGPTNVNAGTLRQGAANAVPSGSAVTLPAGTTFDLNGHAASVGSIAGAGNVTTGGADLTVGNDNTSTVFSGTFSGGGTFTKNGTGTLELNRPAGAGAADPIVPINGPIIVNGGTLQFNNLNQSTYDLPSNDITVNAGANITLGSAPPNGGVFFNRIQGAGSVTIGTNYLVLLTENNDYTGGTVITNGATASITQLSSLGATGSPIHFKGHGVKDLGYAGGLWFEIGDHVTPVAGTFSHPISVDGWKIAILSARGNDITLDQPVSGDGIIQWANGGFGGTFRLNAVNTYKGISQIDGGTNIVLGVDNALPPSGTAMLFSSSLNLNGHDQTLGYFISAGSPTVDLTDATLTIKNDIDPAFGGAWSGTISGAGNIVKTGGGLQQFSLPAGLANTYTGGTTVEQGTLQIIGNINGLPAGGAVVIGQDGCLQLTPTAVDSGLAVNTPVTFSGDISGAGEVQVTTLETLVLAGNNTYTGGTRISNGRLLVSADGNMGAPTGKIIFHSNGSNPGPILTYGAAFNSTRDVTVDTANAFVDTREHNVALGNVQANPLLPKGSFYKLAGAGSLTVNHVRGVNTLGVWEGTLRIAPSGGSAAGVSTASTLSILPAGRLDLSDNKLITAMAPGTWNGTSYTDVAGLVDAGRGPAGNALWDGTTGIVTSDTRAINNGDLVSIGVAKVGDVRTVADTETTTFAGQTVLGSDTLVMATWGGDANLDGKINIDDYGRIDGNVGQSGSVFGWDKGDFNYDGKINIDDYGIIDGNINRQGAAFATAGSAASLEGVAAVPEPASLSLIALGAMGLTCRRRRHGA